MLRTRIFFLVVFQKNVPLLKRKNTV